MDRKGCMGVVREVAVRVSGRLKWRGNEVPGRSLLILLLFSGVVQARLKDSSDAAFEVAMSFKISGKGKQGHCYAYAGDLYNRIAELGVETYMITYDWEKSGRRGRHSMVVYSDNKGRYWGMDNMSRRPAWLEGASLEAWVTSFEKGGTGSDPLRLGVQIITYTTNTGVGNVSRIYAVNR